LKAPYSQPQLSTLSLFDYGSAMTTISEFPLLTSSQKQDETH
jgi:hypothetical protein